MPLGESAARRVLDLVLASLGLVVTAPILAVAAIGIRLSSPGPVLYRARRAGRDGRPFIMYKLRTMHVTRGLGSRITAPADRRVFPFGRLLRVTKIDELPQLWNVLRGDMAIIGPRPEDPDFVAQHYAPVHLETLRVRPGLTSPGSLYYVTHADHVLDGNDPEGTYLQRVLPIKLALDLEYVRRGGSLRYDLSLIGRTLWIIAASALGRRRFPEPPEAEVHTTLQPSGN